MGIDRNSVDDPGAEEDRRLIKEELLRSQPLLRWNPLGLQRTVDAIYQGAQAGSMSSAAAINSSGTVNDSDLNRDLGREGFFSNMEGYRQSAMQPPETLPPTNDPEDDRYFGENVESAGQQFVARATTDDRKPHFGGRFAVKRTRL